MQTVSLGQAFLIRRDFLQTVNQAQSELRNLGYHREDRPVPTTEFAGAYQANKDLQAKLVEIDLSIERANNTPGQVTFKDQPLSLNECRRMKVRLTQAQQNQTNLIQQITMITTRTESEYVMEGGVQIPKVRSFILLADLKELKKDSKDLAKDIRLLDSLIQKADWEVQVQIPETDED